jgi:hypothetical protein
LIFGVGESGAQRSLKLRLIETNDRNKKVRICGYANSVEGERTYFETKILRALQKVANSWVRGKIEER